MFKEIYFLDDARKKILEGVNIVADAVCATLGPR
jgi:chaperonin GroEL (HSP60 family)